MSKWPAQIFFGQKPKLQRELRAKRRVHSNFEHPQGIFYHNTRAPKLFMLAKIANLELLYRGKICPEGAQKWSAITFGPEVPD